MCPNCGGGGDTVSFNIITVVLFFLVSCCVHSTVHTSLSSWNYYLVTCNTCRYSASTVLPSSITMATSITVSMSNFTDVKPQPVFDDPVVLIVGGAVAHNKHTMVELPAATAAVSVDTT